MPTIIRPPIDNSIRHFFKMAQIRFLIKVNKPRNAAHTAKVANYLTFGCKIPPEWEALNRYFKDRDYFEL